MAPPQRVGTPVYPHAEPGAHLCTPAVACTPTPHTHCHERPQFAGEAGRSLHAHPPMRPSLPPRRPLREPLCTLHPARPAAPETHTGLGPGSPPLLREGAGRPPRPWHSPGPQRYLCLPWGPLSQAVLVHLCLPSVQRPLRKESQALRTCLSTGQCAGQGAAGGAPHPAAAECGPRPTARGGAGIGPRPQPQAQKRETPESMCHAPGSTNAF